MVFTQKKEEQLRKMPAMEAKVLKSKDGKYVIHKTIITTIRPVEYYKKVLSNESGLGVREDEEGLQEVVF